MTYAARPAALALALFIAACSTQRSGEDSSAASAAASESAAAAAAASVAEAALADSLRRAESTRVADSVAARTRAQLPRSPGGSKSATPRATTDSLKLNPNLGRDSVIRRPRRIPAMDTLLTLR